MAKTSMLLMILVDLVRVSRRFPFKDGGKDTTRVIMYDWWCAIRWQSIRVSHSVVSQVRAAIVPQCVPSPSYYV